MSTRQTFIYPREYPEYVEPDITASPEVRAFYADAMPHPAEMCAYDCAGGRRHPVTWRIHPRPDPGPIVADGVITVLVECCTCCAWRCGVEGYIDRLQRESFDGRDIKIERLIDGDWHDFERRFQGVA